MEVILGSDQKPAGVFLSLSEWEEVKRSVSAESRLYQLMDKLSQRDVFDMNAAEIGAHLQPTIDQAVEKSLNNGLYFSYPAGQDAMPGTFIHDYGNGKKVLVKVDTATGREQFLRKL